MSFTAQFPGECADCFGAIHPGQEISRNADGTYRHAACPTPGLTVVDLAPGETPCGGCQLVHRGDCF